MMTSQDLELLIKQGEGYNLEFKQSLPSKASDLAEEICAFANAAGGTLLIGVDDKGKVVGLLMDNTSRSRLQNILNCVEPPIEVTSTEVVVNDKTVLSLECKSGKEKTYTVSGSIIVRNGPNSEKITSVQRMRDFFQQSDKIFFDEAPCKKFKYPDDFDSEAFQSFLKASGIQNTLPQDILLKNLQLSEENGEFKNGAVLLFAKNPQKFHEQAITRCILFKGTNKTYILDDKSFSGSLLRQYNSALAYLHQKLNLNYIIQGTFPATHLFLGSFSEWGLLKKLVPALRG
jgi:ATP-dependent DNA helicase RecG